VIDTGSKITGNSIVGLKKLTQGLLFRVERRLQAGGGEAGSGLSGRGGRRPLRAVPSKLGGWG
jgi:hypothetical protein